MKPICRRAREYLSKVQHEPIINVAECNSQLYRHVPALERVKTSRLRLQKMEPYLVTCEEGAEIYNYYMHGRKYLCNQLDVYRYLYRLSLKLHSFSIADLVEFKDESLEATIKTCLSLGKKHIFDCERCKMKGTKNVKKINLCLGFYCEMCGSNELIFPFELETTVVCETCFTCFHKACFDGKCPKCARREARQKARVSSDTD